MIYNDPSDLGGVAYGRGPKGGYSPKRDLTDPRAGGYLDNLIRAGNNKQVGRSLEERALLKVKQLEREREEREEKVVAQWHSHRVCSIFLRYRTPDC